MSTERNQRAPQGLCPWESHQGVPPGSLSGPGEALVAHRLVKSFPAQTASQMLGIHKVFLALCSLLDGKIPVHTVPPENSPRPRMGQTPHTLLSLRGYWKIPCGGIPPPATPTGPPPSGGGWSEASFLSLPGPKGSIFSAEKITEYGQLSGGLAPAGTPSPALRA